MFLTEKDVRVTKCKNLVRETRVACLQMQKKLLNGINK